MNLLPNLLPRISAWSARQARAWTGEAPTSPWATIMGAAGGVVVPTVCALSASDSSSPTLVGAPLTSVVAIGLATAPSHEWIAPRPSDVLHLLTMTGIVATMAYPGAWAAFAVKAALGSGAWSATSAVATHLAVTYLGMTAVDRLVPPPPAQAAPFVPPPLHPAALAG